MTCIFKAINYNKIASEDSFLAYFINLTTPIDISKSHPEVLALVTLKGGEKITLGINLDLFKEISYEVSKTILRHEALHCLFGHLNVDKEAYSYLAKELAINTLLNRTHIREANGVLPENYNLEDNLTEKQYDQLLTQDQKEEFEHQEGQEGGGGECSDLADTLQTKLLNQAKNYGLGELSGTPSDKIIKALISSSVPKTNWRTALRRWMATCSSSEKIYTRRRYNKRFPNMAGSYKKKKLDILVAIDQSGSVGDRALAGLFTELLSISKECNLTVVPFTDIVHSEEEYEVRSPKDVITNRTRCGGTSFDAVHEYWKKEHKNKKLIVFTDGEDHSNLNWRDSLFALTQDIKLDFTKSSIYLDIDI